MDRKSTQGTTAQEAAEKMDKLKKNHGKDMVKLCFTQLDLKPMFPARYLG